MTSQAVDGSCRDEIPGKLKSAILAVRGLKLLVREVLSLAVQGLGITLAVTAVIRIIKSGDPTTLGQPIIDALVRILG